MIINKETETSESESAVSLPSRMDIVRTEMQLAMSAGLAVAVVICGLPWSSSANVGPPVTAPSTIANRQPTLASAADGSNSRFDAIEGRLVDIEDRFVCIEGRLGRLEDGQGRLEVGQGGLLLLMAATYVEMMKTMKKDKADMIQARKEHKAEFKRDMKQMEVRTDIKFFVTILAGFAFTWYRTR